MSGPTTATVADKTGFIDSYGNQLPFKPKTVGQHQKILHQLARAGTRVKIDEQAYPTWKRAHEVIDRNYVKMYPEADVRLDYVSKFRNGNPIFEVFMLAGSGFSIEVA